MMKFSREKSQRKLKNNLKSSNNSVSQSFVNKNYTGKLSTNNKKLVFILTLIVSNIRFSGVSHDEHGDRDVHALQNVPHVLQRARFHCSQNRYDQKLVLDDNCRRLTCALDCDDGCNLGNIALRNDYDEDRSMLPFLYFIFEIN